MARLFLDLLILAVLSKELAQSAWAGLLNYSVFIAALLGLPFFLGMAAPAKPPVSLVRDPIRSLIRSGITVTWLILYWYLQALQGTPSQFLFIFFVSLLPYFLGRIA